MRLPLPRLPIDPFLGSGSTLIAAEKTGRVCRGVELDPLYVDVIVRRFEAVTGLEAVYVETGETFSALAVRRERQAVPAEERVASWQAITAPRRHNFALAVRLTGCRARWTFARP